MVCGKTSANKTKRGRRVLAYISVTMRIEGLHGKTCYKVTSFRGHWQSNHAITQEGRGTSPNRPSVALHAWQEWNGGKELTDCHASHAEWHTSALWKSVCYSLETSEKFWSLGVWATSWVGFIIVTIFSVVLRLGILLGHLLSQRRGGIVVCAPTNTDGDPGAGSTPRECFNLSRVVRLGGVLGQVPAEFVFRAWHCEWQSREEGLQ